MRPATLALLAALAGLSPKALAEPPLTVVACAPGYPGTSAEAQSAMDAFAAVLTRAAGWAPGQVVAGYAPTEKEGLARFGEAAVGMVALPFFVQHGRALGMTPQLVVEQKGLGPTERWALVAKKGRVTRPADVARLTVFSLAGYAPGFVRNVLAPEWRLPEATPVTASAQVLSALRRASQGEDVAVLLDGAQGNALPTLPFAAELEVVARSAPLPAALVVRVGKRLGASRWAVLEKAFLALPGEPAGAAALEGIRMVGFTPVSAATLDAVQKLAVSAQ